MLGAFQVTREGGTWSLATFVCSLALLTPLTRYAALRFAMLAHSVHGLAHSLLSFPCGTIEILEYVFML